MSYQQSPLPLPTQLSPSSLLTQHPLPFFPSQCSLATKKGYSLALTIPYSPECYPGKSSSWNAFLLKTPSLIPSDHNSLFRFHTNRIESVSDSYPKQHLHCQSVPLLSCIFFPELISTWGSKSTSGYTAYLYLPQCNLHEGRDCGSSTVLFSVPESAW